MSKIRIGQIGIGHNHAEGKMLCVRKFPELFEVVGSSESDPAWLEKRGGLSAYEGLARLDEDELIAKSDAIIVESDVWNLTRTAQKCIDCGKPIHMDKPASGTLAEYARLLKCAEERKLPVQLGYMYRYNPAILSCIEHIRRGDLGEIYSINAEISTFHPPEYRQWLRHFPGGIMYILGSHLIDLIVYILGEPERCDAYLHRTGLDGVDVPDLTLAVLSYKKALARVFVSSVEVNGWGRRQFSVAGSRGTIQIMPIERKCAMTYTDTTIATNAYADQKEIVDAPDVPDNIRYDAMMRDFYDFVQGTKQNPFTYAHELRVQKVLTQIAGELTL